MEQREAMTALLLVWFLFNAEQRDQCGANSMCIPSCSSTAEGDQRVFLFLGVLLH